MQTSPTTTGLYLSQILDKPLRDAHGERIARIQDLVVRFGSGPHPAVSGLVARQGRRPFFVEWARVAALSSAGARLDTFTLDLQPFVRRDGEALLRRDILDKQLIDVDGRRVVRASDLRLDAIERDYRLVGVDVSVRGLVRRIGPARLTSGIEGRELINWADVESFATDVPMVRLRVPHDGVAKLHPVEIARIMGALTFEQGQEVLAALDDETAAETVPELDPDAAADHLGALDRERAADILDEMDPDDAANLLGELPEEHAEDLLTRMEPDESADVRELLAYDEDTAAGMMTTDFAVLPAGLTAGDALVALRALPEPPDPLYHVYIVPHAGSWQLAGVVSLRDLVFATPEVPVADLLAHDFRTAALDTDPKEVARMMAEYNLPELPVLDEAGDICGVVLIDDAIDTFYPELWHQRLAQGFR